MDEDYLRSCFTRSPELVSVVIKRNKQTRQSEGYGFLNFDDHVAADQILKSYNGQQMPDSSKHFRLNWVTHTPPPPAAAADTHTDPTTDHTIYVGNLAYDVTDYMLHHVFKSRYSSIKTANVVCDKSTGRSKGYAFVLFGDANERTQAMTEMNGAYCSTRPIRICPVTNKKSLSHDAEGSDSDCNPNDSRLFIGSLDPSVTDEDLMEAFGAYGELVNVKVITGKQVGFVKYSSRASAEEAIKMLNGSQLAGHAIRVQWDRWNGGLHGQPQCSGPDPDWCSQDPNKQNYTTDPGYGYDQQG